jgi:hypothetical protein
MAARNAGIHGRRQLLDLGQEKQLDRHSFWQKRSLDGSVPRVKSELVNEFFNNTQHLALASRITIESNNGKSLSEVEEN